MGRRDDIRFGRIDCDDERFRVFRIKPVEQIRISSEYAEFLADEIDSPGYARSLVNARRLRKAVRATHSPGPGDTTDARGSEDCIWAAQTARTSPEYQRYLHEEISSREYAASIARYASLEELFRAPTRVPSIARGQSRMSIATKVMHFLHLGFSFVGSSFVAVAILAVLAVKSVDLVPPVVGSIWTTSLVGAFLFMLTVLLAGSSLLLGWAHSFQAWLDDWKEADYQG